MDACARPGLRIVSSCVSKPLGLVFVLSAVAVMSLLLTSSHLHTPGAAPPSRRRGKAKIHVCLCSDDTDLRPSVVAIRSTLESAGDPSRLLFHYITSPELAPLFRDQFRTYLPGVHIEVHYNQKLQEKIEALIPIREAALAKTRVSLASPLNFAPFYLHEFLTKDRGHKTGAKRAIYIDTDTVVLGDVGELHDLNLQGRPCAAAKYCLQHWDDFIDFEVLRELGFQSFAPKSCIANRGIMVVDLPRWNKMNITGKIEDWLVRYRNAKKLLWQGGMSQPPWLLALDGDYFELSEDWNCNGLGRDTMSAHESHMLRQEGFDRSSLRALHTTWTKHRQQFSPFVVSCSRTGKLLHFNGAVKPWLLDTEMGEHALPSCSLPKHFPISAWSWSLIAKVFCKGIYFVECADLWSAFISPGIACALRDFDKEWRDEETVWSARRHELEASREQARMEEERRQKAAASMQGEFQDMFSGDIGQHGGAANSIDMSA